MFSIRPQSFALPALTLLAVAAACTPPDGGRETLIADAYVRLLAAEDARPGPGPTRDVLLSGAHNSVVLLRRTAVRALGRLEDPELVEVITPLLDDPAPSVRAEAANALAQAVHRGEGDAVVPALLDRVEVERDSLALAALARSLGRTATTQENRRRVTRALLGMSRDGDGHDAPLSTLLGVALGFESLVRSARAGGLPAEAAARLVELSQRLGAGGGDVRSDRLRALAVSTLGQARRLDWARIEATLMDPAEPVRILAARHVDGLAPGQRPEMLRRLLSGGGYRGPLEAVLQIARQPRTELYCSFLLAATEPRAPAGIRVAAMDALARPCPTTDEQVRALRTEAASIAQAPSEWQPPAHALVALARLSPEDARAELAPFATHENPFVRAYAAVAAGALGDVATLDALASDPVANVRTAALPGLIALHGHDVDPTLVAQLAEDDPQLLITAAGLLAGSPLGATAADALLGAFERISEARRETWRDPRKALLERIAELGDASLADRLTPFLSDYDNEVADDVAGVLEAWTGSPAVATPQPLPRRPLPTGRELLDLVGARVVLHMERGDVVVELDPFSASTNVDRFVKLAESGYFDGLTFHRWAPNFVLQGGSPGANEYQGDGPYTRDEVGLPVHWRGTVGISTRGRDTGDGQIFVNLVDNVRLDHDYTIVGHVVAGMDVVDAALEGAVIERAEVVRGG